MKALYRPLPQVGPHHYEPERYDTKERFVSYWIQAETVARFGATRVLEVGIGNRFVSNLLSSRGIEVVAVDIDPALIPSVAASANALPFAAGEFDMVVCCQVLEHMPFEVAEAALAEYRRVSTIGALVSLPNVIPAVRLMFPVPRVGEIQLLVRNWLRRVPFECTQPGEHIWELGMAKYAPDRFRGAAVRAGFTVARDYRSFDNPYHHFFELRAV